MTRVLVVDDEIDTLNLLRIILEISGFEAVTTLNSTDALTLAEVERPDCVLLDIMMPQLDGFTLCKMLRRHPATAHLPIVFVTAYSALDLEDRRREAGADLVLPKPVGMDTLLDTIGQAMALRKDKKPEVVPQAVQLVTPPVAAYKAPPGAAASTTAVNPTPAVTPTSTPSTNVASTAKPAAPVPPKPPSPTQPRKGPFKF